MDSEDRLSNGVLSSRPGTVLGGARSFTGLPAGATAPVCEYAVVGVLALAGRLVARHLAALSLPVLMLVVPAAIVGEVAIVAVVGDDALIVNGALAPLTTAPRLVWTAATVVLLGVVVQLVAVAAVSVVAAGVLLDRAVGAAAALRAAARRLPALVVLFVIGSVISLVTVAAGVAVIYAGGELWAAVAAMAAPVLASCWLAWAVPLAVLEGLGPIAAIGRAFTATRHRRYRACLVVMVGCVLAPGALVVGARWVLSPWEGVAATTIEAVLMGMVGVLATVVQGTVLAVASLNHWYPPVQHANERYRPVDLDALATRLPSRTPPQVSPPRAVVTAGALAAAMAVPGLVYGGYLSVNPMRLTRVADHRITSSVTGYPITLHLGNRDRPLLVAESTHAGFVAQACEDRSCANGTPFEPIGKAVESTQVGSATLPDGSVAVAAWAIDRKARTEPLSRPRVLRLVRCTVDGCQDVDDAPIVARAGSEAFTHAAAAARSGNGLVIAATGAAFDGRGDFTPQLLRLIHCPDVRCARPRQLWSTRLAYDHAMVDSRSLAVAVGRSGRPIIAHQDRWTGAVTLVSCPDADCRAPSRRKVVAPQQDHPLLDRPHRNGVDLAVTADDRPVLTYRDARTGAARLLRCQDTDCARNQAVTLTGPDVLRPWPALALGPADLPVVATYDLDRGRVLLITCHDAACARRTMVPIAALRHDPGRLEVTVDGDGRPWVLWSDMSPYSNALHLTRCLRPGCRA
ncbi:hypothetical protein ABZ801_35415 [Actinomadura sp. NPDC047616]|uniref:hypothetical protein n=1 Tax=Actinomadura sp. NPDC047616 TaxID=3155914 RepID=UPI0033FFAEEB